MSRPRALRLWPVAAILAIGLLLGLRAVLHTPPLDRLVEVPAVPRDPPLTLARAGTLAITRGGPLRLGFQSDAPARIVFSAPDLVPPEPHDRLRVGMTIDEATRAVPGLARAPRLVDGTHVVARSTVAATLVRVGADQRVAAIALELRGTGLFVERALVRSGTASIHVALPAGARLVWNPVGRRGDPEYVPASSLAPPGTPLDGFDAPGTARLYGTIALAILAIVVASACLLARRRLATVPRATWIAIASVLGIALLARLVGLGDQGQTWDEDVNWGAGRNYVTNVLDLDFSPSAWSSNHEHPPVMKLLAGIGAQFADGFGPARAISAIASALACVLLVPIGARLYDLRAGIAAGLVAALLPPLVAHGQVVGHEAPTQLWWALGILLALGVADAAADHRRLVRHLVAVGIVIGIAAASRFVNGLLGPVCLVIVALTATRAHRVRTLALGAVVMPAAALLTFYVVWPRLWLHPIAALTSSLAKLANTHAPEPFLGAMTATPGPHYFLVYLAATLPVGILLLLAAWLGRSIVPAHLLPAVLRARRPSDLPVRERGRAPWIVLAWLAIPLVGIMASPVRQDGVRYVMPCLLALCLAAGAGLDALARWARHRHAFPFATGIVAAYLAITLARTAPYHLDYFGEHVGSAGHVADRRMLEVAWWGEGLDRAVDHVNAHAAAGDRVHRCIDPVHLAWFREDLWPTMTNRPGDARWIVVYAPATRACPIPAGFTLAHAVTHDGATLAAVYRRR